MSSLLHNDKMISVLGLIVLNVGLGELMTAFAAFAKN
jgi:hypothetical protein